MKKSNNHRYLAGILLAALFLGGCGTAKSETFCSLDGLTITATEDWQPVSDTTTLFEEDFDSTVDSGIDMALADKKGHYLSIERYDCQEQLEDVTRLADQLRQQLAIQGEDSLVQNLTAQGVDETAMDQYRALWQCPVGEEAALYRSLADAAWQKQMAEAAKDYAVVGQEPVTLLGSATILYEYRYTNGDNKAIHGYEASVVWKNKLYNISTWTTDKQFAKSQEQLKAIILSVVRAAQ